MILYCATTNPGKLREFQGAARSFGEGWDVRVLPGLKEIEPPEETAETFEENAILKARYYSKHTGELLFCDDSGLEVDALDGAPGVYSARYAGGHAGDGANNALLKSRMRGRENRAARFRCVVAIARAGQPLAAFHGVVEGLILDEERGSGGFGYDPLFHHPPFNCTLAEASAERKLTVSHRGQALGAMLRWLAARE